MSVKSSGGVFDVLRVISETSNALSASEIASRVGIPLTTASRAISTLETAGFAQRSNGIAKFELGQACQKLAYAFMAQFPLRNVALPYLQQLASISGNSSSLYLRLGRYAVRIAFITGNNSLINARLGEAVPISRGAPGFALLAHCDDADVRRLAAMDDAGDIDTKHLLRRLGCARTNGFACEPSLLDQGWHDLAFPLTNSNGAAVAAIVLEGVHGTVDKLGEQSAEWRHVVTHLQRVLDADPAILHLHYEHVNPDTIEFASKPLDIRT